MEISDTGVLLDTMPIDEIYNRINCQADIRFYFFKNPLDYESISCIADMVGKEEQVELLTRSIYHCDRIDEEYNLKLSTGDLEKLFDKSRQILLIKLTKIR